jgi:hypothetical protein
MNLYRLSFLSLYLLAALPLRGQYSEVSMLPILLQAAPLIEAIEDDYNTIVKMEYDLIFPRAPKETFRQLTPNRTYTFLAFGQEDRIGRVSIRVYQSVQGQWKLISNGKQYSGFSGIEGFTPPENAFYRIEIEAHDFIPPFTAGRYGLIIYHD